MKEVPSYEDAITVGMNALADGITRSFDLLLWAKVAVALRRIGAWSKPRPVQPDSGTKRT